MLALASASFALALCEIGLRVADISFPRFDEPDAEFGSSLIPGATGWFTQEGRAFVSINAAGFRDREHELSRDAATLRIALLGDSFTEGRHVELEETFGAVAERVLASCESLDGRRPEILNFGVSGYGTAQALLLLRNRVVAYEPDWVVLAFFVGNDVRNNAKPLQKGGRPYFVYQDDDQLHLDASFNDPLGQRLRTGSLGRRFYMLASHVRILQLAMAVSDLRRRSEQIARLEEERRAATLADGDELGIDNQVYRVPRDADWELAWRTTEDLLRMMRDDLSAVGARFLLTTLSTAVQVHPDPAVRARFAEKLGVDDLLYPDRRLGEFAAREDIDALGLVLPLRARAEAEGKCLHGFDNAIPCGGHWNQLGHRAAGEELARAICERMTPPEAVPVEDDGETSDELGESTLL